MRAVVQRVLWARVLVEDTEMGSCGRGLLVLLAAGREDTENSAVKMAERIAVMRIFTDDAGKMNLALDSLPDQREPQVLAISNFTVYGDASSRRPSFTAAAPFESGRELFGAFTSRLSQLVKGVSTGVFGADMRVELCNDGPVTLIVEA